MKKRRPVITPIQIGRLTLKNRIIMGPLCNNFCGVEGEVSDRAIAYYARRARGGAALIIIEGTCVQFPIGRNSLAELRLDDDKFIPKLADLAHAIHENGALAAIQLLHPGRFAHRIKEQPVSASDVAAAGLVGAVAQPRALSIDEVEEIIECFGNAAFRAMLAGIDMVDIHGGAGYLVSQFCSRRTNRRTDQYGGSLENRIRFPLRIIERIHQKCGPDFPVAMRINCDEGFEDAFALEEAKVFAKAAEAAGAACIPVPAGTYESFSTQKDGFMSYRSAQNKDAISVKGAREIKKEVKIPVCTQNFTDPKVFDEVIDEGYCDCIILGRPLLADPDLPNKVFAGQHDDVCRCIRCMVCMEHFTHDHPVVCLQNPVAGREREYDKPTPTLIPKKVAVIGAGPAGLEAALVSARRGHKVTVYEKEGKPGGQFNLASLSKGKGVFRIHTIAWRKRQCEKVGVTFKFHETIDVLKARALLNENDALVIATGARWETPTLPGGNAKNAFNNVDVLLGKATIEGKRIAVGVNGPSTSASSRDAAEVAEILAQEGAEVTIIGELPLPGPALGEMNFLNAMILRKSLAKLGVKNIPSARIAAVTKEGLAIIHSDGRRESLSADDIVLAWGVVPNSELPEQLNENVPDRKEIYVIGDCVTPRNAYRAIQDGHRVGLTI